jgi:Flp pilus assembly protein TadD
VPLPNLTPALRRPSVPSGATVALRWRRAVRAGALGLACLPVLAADAPSAREIERLYRAGETTQAMQGIDRAIAERPANPTLRFLRGVMLSESHRDAEAAEAFVALTRDFPDMPEPYNNLAVLLAGQGDLDGARALLEDALRRDPGYATAQENLGDVLVRLAQRSYEAAASAPRPAASLLRKLQIVRTLDTAPAGAGR